METPFDASNFTAFDSSLLEALKAMADVPDGEDVEVRLQYPGQSLESATVLSTMPQDPAWLLLKSQPPGSKVLVREVSSAPKWRDGNFGKGRWLFATIYAMDIVPVSTQNILYMIHVR